MVGAGAVGEYCGALPTRAGRDVTFLVRPRRAQQLRAGGIRVDGLHETFTVSPQLDVTGAVTSTYDAIVLAVKAYSLDDAICDFAPAVGAETMIVPLLNGMRHLDVLSARFGERAVLGGVSMIATQLEPGGGIRQLGEGAAITWEIRSKASTSSVISSHVRTRSACACRCSKRCW